MTLQEDGYEIYESKINYGIKHDYEILESMATFHHKGFLEQIKDNLDFYGMTLDSFAKSINISSFRMSCLLNKNAEFEPREIELIRKRLHI